LYLKKNKSEINTAANEKIQAEKRIISSIDIIIFLPNIGYNKIREI
jgi:hypothetical protein